MAVVYKIYMVFENESVEGKYIPLLYSADDVPGSNAVLPSDSTTYTFPSGSGIEEKEVYLLKDVIVFGPFVNTTYASIWMNDQKTEHIIVNAINTRETVKRQFETIKLYFKEGTSIRLKLVYKKHGSNCTHYIGVGG